MLPAAHTYETPGEYRVMVKAIDILGNDTTKVVEVTVPGWRERRRPPPRRRR